MKKTLDADYARRRAIRQFFKSTKSLIGLALVGMFVFFALFADVVAPFDDNEVSGLRESSSEAIGPSQRLKDPSARHWLGTDSAGYDVFSRVIYGSRLSLLTGVISIVLAVVIGAPTGLAAGYFGGRIDTALMRSVDVFLAFPSILIAFLVLTVFDSGWMPVIAAVALINVPVFARQVRATVLTSRDLDYVTAARAAGADDLYIMRRALLPSCINPIVVLATLGLGSAIIEVAGLSFLGFGGDAGDAEWGSMLNLAKNELSHIWPAIGPGLAISLTVLGFNLLGDGLRDALDPRLVTKGS